MRIQAAITITALFLVTAWGSCASEGVEHPSKNDAGAPADGGDGDGDPKPEGETGAEKPAVIEVAPVKASK